VIRDHAAPAPRSSNRTCGFMASGFPPKSGFATAVPLRPSRNGKGLGSSVLFRFGAHSMQFTFVAACRYGTGRLPTQPRGCAVIPAFYNQWHNSMDVTFTHVDLRPTGVLPLYRIIGPLARP